MPGEIPRPEINAGGNGHEKMARVTVPDYLGSNLGWTVAGAKVAEIAVPKLQTPDSLKELAEMQPETSSSASPNATSEEQKPVIDKREHSAKRILLDLASAPENIREEIANAIRAGWASPASFTDSKGEIFFGDKLIERWNQIKAKGQAETAAIKTGGSLEETKKQLEKGSYQPPKESSQAKQADERRLENVRAENWRKLNVLEATSKETDQAVQLLARNPDLTAETALARVRELAKKAEAKPIEQLEQKPAVSEKEEQPTPSEAEPSEIAQLKEQIEALTRAVEMLTARLEGNEGPPILQEAPIEELAQKTGEKKKRKPLTDEQKAARREQQKARYQKQLNAVTRALEEGVLDKSNEVVAKWLIDREVKGAAAVNVLYKMIPETTADSAAKPTAEEPSLTPEEEQRRIEARRANQRRILKERHGITEVSNVTDAELDEIQRRFNLPKNRENQNLTMMNLLKQVRIESGQAGYQRAMGLNANPTPAAPEKAPTPEPAVTAEAPTENQTVPAPPAAPTQS